MTMQTLKLTTSKLNLIITKESGRLTAYPCINL
jgi:hypothetical protein